MKTLVYLATILFARCVCAQEIYYATGGLYALDNKEVVLIHRLKDPFALKGYAVLNHHNIFLAYDRGTSAEANTSICVFNTQTRRETVLTEIGGSGESVFHFNKHNGSVVFNWYNGIYCFKLLGKKGLPSDRIVLTKIRDYDKDRLSVPFWVGQKRLLLLKGAGGDQSSEIVNLP